MTSTDPGAGPEKRDHRLTRLANLQALRIDGRKRIDEDVRANLRRWYDEGGVRPSHIEIRAGFARRRPPLTRAELAAAGDIVDRPKPDLPRPPSLARLTAIPKGVALRTALTLLFLVQANPTALRAGGRVDIPVVGDGDDHPMGLVDLIAVNATHTVGPDGGEYAATTATNRQRQIRSALNQLDRLGLVELPPGGRGNSRYHDVRLRSENGNTAGTEPPVYKRAGDRVATFEIPVAFFLEGWVHSLTSREIANWLMYRDLRAQIGSPDPTEDGSAPFDLRVNAVDRLTEYDLTRSTWDTHRNLFAFGLLEMWSDPRRRPNGTTADGKRAEPHRFRLTDDGLTAPGVETVETVLKNMEIDLNL